MRTPSRELRAVFKKWAARYRAFARERFIRLSEGGGSWPPLAKSTLAARRRKAAGKRKGKRPRSYRMGASVSLDMRPRILRNLGLLLGALRPTLRSEPGRLEEQLEHGVRVGYGGPHRYPGGGPAIADIAEFHQLGAGRVPVREIIVTPDEYVTSAMAHDLQVGIERMGR